MKRWTWIAVGLAAALLAACQAAPGAVSPHQRLAAQAAARQESSSLYPLIPGARWEYRLLQRQDQGPVREKPMAITVASAEAQPSGVTMAVLERRYETWAPPATRVLRSAEKVVLSRLADPIDGPSITIMQLPLEVGARWPGRPLSGGNKETIIPQGPERVTVPAGTYEAERVDHLIEYAPGGTDTLSYWYARGVGVVKMIERSTLFQGDGVIRLEVTGELKAYTPGLR